MGFKKPRSKNLRVRSTDYSSVNRERGVIESDSAALARAALFKTIVEVRTTNKKRNLRIQKLRYLTYELQSLQPAEITELAEALGQSVSTTRSQLKRLQKLDLVTRIEFEANVLYAINGHYNKFVQDILNDLYE
jgi:DNA-binding MarR family transcriptional regulator